MQRKKMKKLGTIVLLIFSVVVFFGCSAKTEYIKAGDTITGKHYELVIDKVEVMETVQFIDPAKGNVFVAIKFHYKNITKESMEYKGLPTVALVSKDKTYKINYEASNIYAIMEDVDYSTMTESLDAGQTRADAEVYEVPKADAEQGILEVKVDKTNKAVKVENSAQPAAK